LVLDVVTTFRRTRNAQERRSHLRLVQSEMGIREINTTRMPMKKRQQSTAQHASASWYKAGLFAGYNHAIPTDLPTC